MHGGNIYNRANLIKLDYSVNINPLGMPESLKHALDQVDIWAGRYPEPEVTKLRERLAQKHHCKPDHVLCGNGASELLMLYMQAFRPSKVLLSIPCFTGYLHALQAVDATIQYYGLKEQEDYLLEEGFLRALEDIRDLDLVILCRPNNPTGRLIPKTLLEAILKVTRQRGIALLVDECFLDFTSEWNQSLCDQIQEYENLAVLQAFTKNYCLSGVRLGMLYTAGEQLMEKMKALQPEWSVSTIAQELGCLAVEEDAFLRESRQLIEAEREYLQKQLEELGFQTFPGEANFLMLYGPEELDEKLEQEGILIRNLKDIPGLEKQNLYRIAVKQHPDNQVLIEALKKIQKVR